MKKISILGLCFVAGLTMSAQKSLMKEVESTIKSGSFDYPTVKAKVEEITTNPETKDDAKAWMLGGNAAFTYYDALFLKVQMGQEVDKKEMGSALVDGYDYMFKALPLDTVVDEKGKVKTKESKKITKSIIENHASLFSASESLIQMGENDLAYKLLTTYVNTLNDARFAKIKENLNPELLKYAHFYKAYVSLNTNKFEECLADCDKALELGYNDKQLFDVALGAAFASQPQNLDAAYSYAEKAYGLYGKQDANYLKNIININVYRKEYDKAKAFLNGLLAAEPTNAECYNLMGSINDAEGDRDAAIENFKKAIECDGSLAEAHYNLGKVLADKAFAINDGLAADISVAEYEKVYNTQLVPLFKEATIYLEKAYELDEQNLGSKALIYLRNLYSNLRDEENLNRVNLM